MAVRKRVEAWLNRCWYEGGRPGLLLSPLSLLYAGLLGLHRAPWQLGLRQPVTLPVPVVVVGNITVGGTGKTPLVLWMARVLREAGWHPGIITRGYGGTGGRHARLVTADDKAREVGDEALLLARRAGCPVACGPDRVADARLLLASHGVDVIISDDGLQHLRLGRALEWVVIDGARGLGNARLLPAGPLRESAHRLQRVDAVVVNGEPADSGFADALPMRLTGDTVVNLASGEEKPLAAFSGQCLHAVAGIGNPRRFFDYLRQLADVQLHEHAFGDHYQYSSADLHFNDDAPIVMTEKDAVKCADFADGRYWYLPVAADLPQAARQRLLDGLARQAGILEKA